MSRALSMSLLSCLALGVLGCATAKEMLALRQVDFRFAGVTDPRVAGIPLERVHAYSDLSVADLGRLGVAIAGGSVPLDLFVHVEGRNPESNNVTARLVALEWTYLVDDRETVSGSLSEAYSFPPGEPRDVPLRVTFDLMDLFGDRSRDLIEVALALTGQRASTHRTALRLIPTVETALGPMRYPVPITLDLATPAAR